MLDAFKNKHKGLRAFVVGKGPSLDKIEVLREEMAGSVVLCCNESVHKVEQVNPDATIYVVQQDEVLKGACIPERPGTVHFMNAYQKGSGKKVRKLEKSPWAPNAVLYDPYALGEGICTFTALIACRLALLMGMSDVTFLCFDSWAEGGSTKYAACIGGDGADMPRHAIHKRDIIRQAKAMGLRLWARLPDVEV